MAFILLIFSYLNLNRGEANNVNLFILSTIIFIINLIYFIFIFDIIAYFNNIIIIYDTNLVILQSWLFIRENIEIIDLNQITKLNIECQ